jgi:hypothetical protein
VFDGVVTSATHIPTRTYPQALHLDEYTIRMSSLETMLKTLPSSSSSSSHDQQQPTHSTEFSDILLTRLVCKPHTLPRFASPVLFHMGLNSVFWEPRLRRIVKTWFGKNRIAQELLKDRELLKSYVPLSQVKKKKHRLTHAELRSKLKFAGWIIREKQQSHFTYIYDNLSFTSLSEAIRHHVDHVGTTDREFYFKIDDSVQDDPEAKFRVCRNQCGFRIYEKDASPERVLDAHEKFCRVGRVCTLSLPLYLSLSYSLL